MSHCGPEREGTDGGFEVAGRGGRHFLPGPGAPPSAARVTETSGGAPRKQQRVSRKSSPTQQPTFQRFPLSYESALQLGHRAGRGGAWARAILTEGSGQTGRCLVWEEARHPRAQEAEV